MIESLSQYFEIFKNTIDDRESRQMNYFEVLGISWALHVLYAFYSVFALFLGVKSYTYFSQSKDFSHLLLDTFSFKIEKIMLITSLFTVVLYPFLFQFAYKFWRGSFKFYANIFESDAEFNEENSSEILSKAFSANIFLVLPIAGNILSNIAFYYFIFQGLKGKYFFSSLQAGLVLLTPLFMLFLAVIFSASYFVFLLTLL